jgi:hypothetical protein
MNTNNNSLILFGGDFNYTTKDNKKGVFYELCFLTERGMRIFKATKNAFGQYKEECNERGYLKVSAFYFDEYGRIANLVIDTEIK